MNNYFENLSFNQSDFKRPGEYVECTFQNIDFQDFNMSTMKFIDCKFDECNLSNLSMKSCVIRGATFTRSKAVGVDWTGSTGLSGASFNECILDFGVFQNMNLKSCKFIDCRIHEADFYESSLMKSDFSNSSLEGSVFNEADLREADFRGARDYQIDVRTTKVAKAKFSMSEAVNLLSSLGIILE